MPHMYIEKSQSSYFKTLKKSSPIGFATVSVDFKKNYSVTIQDEAQGYYWISASCNVHPVLVHLRNANCEKIVLSHCVISDNLKHDVCMVCGIQIIIIEFIKKNTHKSKIFTTSAMVVQDSIRTNTIL